MKYRFVILLMSALGLFSCKDAPEPVALKPAPKTPPAWASQAIWYQIMVERFYNGDPSNDPTVDDILGAPPGFVPSTWQVTPWTQNWHTPDPYFKDVLGKPDMNDQIIHSAEAKMSLRRYGGDLQGVITKLDYLENLGINAIYLNPINDAPSSRKYDARYWHHVDVNFGPDPSGDKALINSEDPSDPSTWIMTHADTLFLELIQQAKARNIRIIIDYAWHYTGQQFWAWQDVVSNPQESPYSRWYSPSDIDQHKDNMMGFTSPSLAITGNKALLAHTPDANIKSAQAKRHIMAVTRRWLDPNGDGDPSDGIDGFKLSNAQQLPPAFWQEYRIYVKSINPQALLVAETTNDVATKPLFSPNAKLQGDTFDALIHFDWYQKAKAYFTPLRGEQSASEFSQALSSITSVTDDYSSSAINMMASHESERLLTSLSNTSDGKNNAGTNAGTNAGNIYGESSRLPTQNTLNKAKLLLLHQFTYVGAPHIWAGDEMGMWGNKPPHNTKPLMWPEYSFERQGTSQDAGLKLGFNQDLFDYYQFLVKLRRANPFLASNNITHYDSNDSKGLFSYLRYDDISQSDKSDKSYKSRQSAYVVFNMSRKRQQIMVPNKLVQAQSWLLWESMRTHNISKRIPSEQLFIDAQSALVVIVSH